MLKRFIHGGMKICSNQEGNILILSIFLTLAITIIFAGMVEFGRVMIVREQLQTAADAAALAAAGSGTHRQVTISVTTDLGQFQPPCGPDGECPPCGDCGEVTRSGITGDESDLIDNGEWRDYCAEPCDCGGGDCWFSIESRELMYDTYSMGTRYTAQQLNNAVQQATDIEKRYLPQMLREYESEVAYMIRDLDLDGILMLFENRNAWVQNAVVAQGYNPTCYYPCSIGKSLECSVMQMRCFQAYEAANMYYEAKVKEKIPRLERSVARKNKMIATNNAPVARIDKITDGIASAFFEANLPRHAEDAGITQIEVYGYDKKSDPRYPSVVVYAASQIQTLFPQWFPGGFRTEVCAQGVTAYRDADDQKSYGNKFYGSLSNFGKWSKVPKDACYDNL